MHYRCPYCKRSLGAEPLHTCPDCGKTMVVPSVKAPSARRVRKRKIERLRREHEQKRAELRGAVEPGVWRNPKLYVGIIVLLAVTGGAVFKATDDAMQRKVEPPHRRAMRHVDALAEALGRYRFHVGTYPTDVQGLAALVRDPLVPKWNGPYINQLRKDPWGVPYVYGPPVNGEAAPQVLSCGPDKIRGTPDDIHPDPARFEPGTAWTNGWVSAQERLPGIKVLNAIEP